MSLSLPQQELLAQFNSLKNWEERYRHILRLGKVATVMNEELKTDNALLNGCESKVWFYGDVVDNQLVLNIYSDAKIVRGLITIINQSFEGLTLVECAKFDCVNFLEELGLMPHLSPSRGNGLRAIIAEIKKLVAS